jgi:hypothetical protein
MRRGSDCSDEGYESAVLGKWLKKLRGEPEDSPLDRDDDPRGGMQSEKYRTADPRDVVEDDGVVMSAPGGAPQDDGDAPTSRRS